MSEYHVIFGTGPVGCWIARALVQSNHQVCAINRSGIRPPLMAENVKIIKADVSDIVQAIEAAKGASVVYQALNPAYHRWHQDFPGLQQGVLAAAKANAARYVSIENLYMMDSSKPMTEESPIRPRSKKGVLRAEMAEEVMKAHQHGDIHATALRSSDYYGPGVVNSAAGEMVFGNLVDGKKAQVSGAADLLHSLAYIEDVGNAAAILGTHQEALGEVWITPHAPALTQGEIVEMACQLLNQEPQLAVISPMMMRMAGLFVPAARESVEMMYEFTEPFVVDSSKFEKAFGISPTPMSDGIKKTVAWYKNQRQMVS